MRYALLINSDKMEPIRLLAADPTIHLSVLTKPKYAPLYAGIAEVWPVDDVANLAQAQAATLAILRHHPIDAIITPLERSLLTGGYLRSVLGLPGPGYDQTLRVAHKLVMKQRLRQAGIPVADFVRVDRLEDIPAIGDQLGWPVVIKPTISSGAMHTFQINSAAHFTQLHQAEQFLDLERLNVPILAERFVPMEAEYHCDGVVSRGEVVFEAVARYFTPVLSNMDAFIGSYILDPADPALGPICELHRAVVAALELRDCVTHLELFGTSQGFLVGEITCRPGGGAIIEIVKRQFGVNIWESFIQAAFQEQPEVESVCAQVSHGWCGLPGRNGRIIAITPSERLYTIPGVSEVRMFHQPGEHVADKRTSVFYSGMVFFEQASAALMETAFQTVRQRFSIEVTEA